MPYGRMEMLLGKPGLTTRPQLLAERLNHIGYLLFDSEN